MKIVLSPLTEEGQASIFLYVQSHGFFFHVDLEGDCFSSYLDSTFICPYF